MKKFLFLILSLSMSLFIQSIFGGTFVYYDGDTMTNFYQCWWPKPEGDPGDKWANRSNYGNWLYHVYTKPYSGNRCGEWVVQTNLGHGGGILLADLAWGKVYNVSTATNFFIWMRGKTGAEQVVLQLITKDSSYHTYFSSRFKIDNLTTNWQRYSFSKSQILASADPGFNLSEFFALYFSSGSPPVTVSLIQSSIFIDDATFQTVGVIGKILIDSDDVTKSLYYRPADRDWISGPTGSSIQRLNIPPGFEGGSYSDVITGGEANSILQIHEKNWALVDLSQFSRLTFGIRGATGNERIMITLYDDNGNAANPIMVTNITTSWQKVSVYLSDLTKGKNFDPSKYKFMQLSFQPGGPGTIHLDNFGFPDTGEIFFNSLSASPSTITNNKEHNVVFSVDMNSLAAGGGTGPRCQSVSMDLSSINGPSDFMLTNAYTNATREIWKGVFTTVTNPYLKGGTYNLPVTIINEEQKLTKYITVTVKNKVPVFMPELSATPSSVTNTEVRDVTFRVKAYSLFTNVKAVYIDLSSLGGPSSVLMTNIPGTSNWQTGYTVNPGVSGGIKNLVTVASDYADGRGVSSIPFLVISYPEILSSILIPSVVSNNTNSDVVIKVEAESKWSSIESVSADLSSLGTGIISLTNISGRLWQNSFSITQGKAGGNYQIQVSAVDTGDLITTQTLSLIIKDKIPPSKPSILSIQSNWRFNEIMLKWSPSSDETAVAGYKIYRGMYPGYYDTTFFVESSVTSWTDRNLKWGQEYYYSISAIDTTSNEGTLSDERKSETVNSLLVYDGDNAFAESFQYNYISFTDSAGSGYNSTTGAVLYDDLPLGYSTGGHKSSPYDYPQGIRIGDFQELRMKVLGTNSTHTFYFGLIFSDGVTSSVYRSAAKRLSLNTNWQEVVITLQELTNRPATDLMRGPVGELDLNNFIGIEFGNFDILDWTWLMYLDDVYFTKGTVNISSWSATPTLISNTSSFDITFEANVTATGTLSSVKINLQELSGPSNADMTNIGGSSYRYTYNVPVLPVGLKHVFITAYDTAGNDKSRMVVITNLDKTPPVAPSFVKAVPNNGKVFLSWNSGSDETGLSGYRIARGISPGTYNFFTNIPNILSFTDKNVINNTSYYYVVYSIDTSGNLSLPTYEVSATPHLITVTSNISSPDKVTNVNNSIVTFALKSITALGTITNVTIDLSSLSGTLVKMNENAGVWSYDFMITSSVYGGIYYLPVYVKDTTEMEFITNIMLTVYQPPVATNGIAIPSVYTNTTDRTVFFRVSARAGLANITSVTLMLSSLGLDNVQMTNITGMTQFGCEVYLSPSIKPLPQGIPLVARAFISGGMYDDALIDFTVVDLMPPSNITQITSQSFTNHVHLEWQSVTDESAISSYEIYRGTSTGSLSLLTTVSSTTLVYDDVPPLLRQIYYYAVKAVDSAGNRSSEYSPYVRGILKKRIVSSDLIVFDGDNEKAQFQSWWGNPTFPTFTVTNASPALDGLSGYWEGGNGSLGSLIRDPSWAGIKVTHMTSLSLWARSEIPGSSINLQPHSPNANNKTDPLIISPPSTWTKYEFSRSQIKSGTFDLAKFVGILTTGNSANVGIFFDNIIFGLKGAPEYRLLDGDTEEGSSANTNRAKMVWYGDPTLQRVAASPYKGSYCEMAEATTPNSQLALFNPNWGLWDIRANDYLSITIRGENGGEGISIFLRDGDGKPSLTLRFTNLSTSWKTYEFKLDDICGDFFDRSRYQSLVLIWSEGAGTVFIDEMKFLSSGGTLSFISKDALPNVITNTKITPIVFKTKVKALGPDESIGPDVKSVKVNLTKIKGPASFYLTNKSGFTNWEGVYLYTNISPTTRAVPGNYSLPVTVSNLDQIVTANISFQVVGSSNGSTGPKGIVFSNAFVSPQKITNNALPRIVSFSVKVVSTNSSIDIVSVDLSPVGLESVNMTNIINNDWGYSFVLTNKIGGTKSFKITAVAHNGSYDSVTVPLEIIDGLPPSKVNNLKAESFKNRVVLKWDNAEDETGIGGYIVSRGTNSSSLTPVAVLSSVTVFTDNDESLKTAYKVFYSVSAFDTSTNIGPESDVVSIEPQGEPKQRSRVQPNYVTPKVENTTVFIELTEENTVSVQIFDMNGYLIKTLLKREKRSPGRYIDVVWDLKKDNGKEVDSGLYFVVVKIGEKITTHKIMVVR